MSQIVKLYKDVCSKRRDNNIKFQELQKLLVALGFNLSRISGDHFIYSKNGIQEIVNIQPDKNDPSKAKSVQVKQLRELIAKYDMEV